MRLRTIILFALVVCCLIVAAGVPSRANANHDGPAARKSSSIARLTARLRAKIPKLFDFAKFKAQFRKGYKSLAEEMRRAKLFMARAMAVFVSGIKYMHRQSSKYLKINSKSDWTIEERRAIMNLRDDRQSSDANDLPSQMVNTDDIEHTLAEVVENKERNPEFAATAAELANSKRKKRSIEYRSTQEQQPQPPPFAANDGAIPAARYLPTLPPFVAQHLAQFDALMGTNELQNLEHVGPLARKSSLLKRVGGFLSHARGSFRGHFHDYSMPADAGYSPYQPPSNAARDTSYYRPRHYVASPPPPPRDEIFLDYRETGCFLAPKNQIDCGACYVFSTIALFEFHHCIQTGKLVPFSEQYAIDCGSNVNMDGCRGGAEQGAAIFARDYGFELMANYPYRGKQQQCPYRADLMEEKMLMGHIKVAGWKFVGLNRGDERLNRRTIDLLLRAKGPLTIAIHIDDGFVDYGGGVDLMKNCGPGGHAMVIIGHGIEDGQEYWLIRNSFDLDFGIDGHYKLSKNIAPKCLMRVGFAEAKFVPNRNHDRKTLVHRVQKQMLLDDLSPGADNKHRMGIQNRNKF